MDEVADSHGKFTREGAAAVEERDYERLPPCQTRPFAGRVSGGPRSLSRGERHPGCCGRSGGDSVNGGGAHTGIPVTRMLKDEAERLLAIEEPLHDA
jgi:hypothetical protein